MASGDSETSPQLESLTCSVCQNILTDPRLLPCHHSFCAGCISGVAASQAGTSFPCPLCRQPSKLPSNGVAGLQPNFYLAPQLEQLDRVKFYCPKHPDAELDMYCTECEVPVCHKCALIKHITKTRNHTIESLSDAARKVKKYLQVEDLRLAGVQIKRQNDLTSTRNEQTAVEEKKKMLEKNIKNRHAIIIAGADKAMKDALQELNEKTAEIERELCATFLKEDQALKDVNEQRKNLKDTIEMNVDLQLVKLAIKMCPRRGVNAKDPELVQNAARSACKTSHVNGHVSKEKESISRPVLCYRLSAHSVVEHIIGFIGTVTRKEFQLTTSSVNTTIQRANIPEDPGTEVFSMSIPDDGIISMSYTWKDNRRDARCETFTSRGSIVAEHDAAGHASYVNTERSQTVYTKYKDNFGTSGKSTSLYSLTCSFPNYAVNKITIIQKYPLETASTVEFKINCSLLRAVDANSTGNLFAVIEDSFDSSNIRTVKVFKRPIQSTSDGQPCVQNESMTYVSPIDHFRPSDVCLFSDYVMLVADENNDAIHVISVKADCLKFYKYVAPGNPLLTQPTSMTIDGKGQLWVACRDRIILVMDIKRDIQADKYRLNCVLS